MNTAMVNNVINSIPSGTRFEFTDYFSTAPGSNKSNGKWFKQNVLNGNISNVRHVSLTSDRHDYYEKI